MAEFQHNKKRIYYELSGKGIPVVFIHPPAMGRMVFRAQEELSRYFTVIFPDLSGNGDSESPDHDISFYRYAEEIRALLNFLHIGKAVICGYSAGGSIAQEFALSFPDRTLGLILISGYPEVHSLGFKYEHLIGMYLVKHFPGLLTKLIASSHTDDRMLQTELVRHMKKANREVWFRWYELSLHYNCKDRLWKMKHPILLIYGVKDFANQHIREYKKQTGYQAIMIPGVSHQLPIKKGKIINQSILGFIYNQIRDL
nr:alpha/beta hydrolase [uncultured Bacillus sp.]